MIQCGVRGDRGVLGREPDLVGEIIRKSFGPLGGGNQFALGIKKACGAWLKVRPDLPGMRPLLNGATMEAREACPFAPPF